MECGNGDGMKICIVGGGNVGTVLAGFVASRGYGVNVLTDHPESWSSEVDVTDPDGKHFSGCLDCVSADPAAVIPDADIVLVCLPGPAIHDKLVAVKPWLRHDALVGSVFSCTGFFIMAINVLGSDARLFGLQRVPFISRLESYGHSAHLLGYRNCIKVAFSGVDDRDGISSMFADMFATPVSVLAHPLEVTLTNSNPILHPSRLYAMFKDCDAPFKEVPAFYSDWTDESSELLIASDSEFQLAVRRLGIAPDHIPSLLDYYESTDAPSLTRKIRSIVAFKGIPAPMKKVEGGYMPDYDNRYFTEDFPYGMMLIKMVCSRLGIATPTIDMIIRWFQERVGKHYIDGDTIADSPDARAVACLDAASIDYLISSMIH